MFDLTKQEKIILVFLAFTFLTGLALNSYKKSRQKIELSVQPYQIQTLKQADQFIARQSLININSFNIDELVRLPGIGEKTAETIVQYHKDHGPFRTKEELMQVKGIGQKKFEQMKDSIILK